MDSSHPCPELPCLAAGSCRGPTVGLSGCKRPPSNALYIAILDDAPALTRLVDRNYTQPNFCPSNLCKPRPTRRQPYKRQRPPRPPGRQAQQHTPQHGQQNQNNILVNSMEISSLQQWSLATSGWAAMPPPTDREPDILDRNINGCRLKSPMQTNGVGPSCAKTILRAPRDTPNLQ